MAKVTVSYPSVDQVEAAEDKSVVFHGWGTNSGDSHELSEFKYHPRPLQDTDIEVDISHCGICGSDIHTLTEGWGKMSRRNIVGHEIVGTVAARGKKAKFQIGDRVGVGAQCDSCCGRQGPCEYCDNGYDQFCPKRAYTYTDYFKQGPAGYTYGGYANKIRVNDEFAFTIPDVIKSDEAAPLLCAGITTYSPLIEHKAGPDKTVGVIGIGGLGHLAIQWARALNCKEVIAISSSDKKREDAKKLGATKYLVSKNEQDIESAEGTIDILICCSFEKHQNWEKLLTLLKVHGKLVLLAVPEHPLSVPAGALIFKGVSMTGSLIGGRKVIQEMFEFAAKHNIRPWIERFPMSKTREAVKHMMEGHPRYRIVLEN